MANFRKWRIVRLRFLRASSSANTFVITFRWELMAKSDIRSICIERAAGWET